MDNSGVYNNIIKKALKENRIKNDNIYYEKHHIIPKCLNGSNEINNIVLLTAREHFLCHWLLVKIHPNNNKLKYAFHIMCSINNNQENRKINSSLFKYAREKINIPLSEEAKNKIRKFNLEKNINSGILAECSYCKKIFKTEPWRFRKAKNICCSKKCSYAFKRGKHLTKEHLQNILESKRNYLGEANPFYGKKHTQATKDKICLTKLGVKQSEKTKLRRTTGYVCEYCGKETGKAHYTRWHGNNCKENNNV